MDVILFLLFGLIAVICAINVVVQTHPISSALSLVGVMASLAVLYLQLGGTFIAAAQLIVYAGAIMVLFIFVIMLLNAGVEERTSLSRTAFYAGVPLAMFLLVELAYRVERASAPMAAQPSPAAATRGLAMLLFQDFAFPFEATSILILIAILGAIVLAKRDV